MSLVLKPAGLLYGADAEAAIAAGAAGRLAGGRAGFTGAHLLTRDGGRRWLGFADLAAAREPAIARRLAALTAPRPPFAGLAMDRPHVMGIVNVTPDSFSDGGVHGEAATAIAAGRRMAAAGASLIDVGGESTRPGSDTIADDEELARVTPVVTALAGDGLVVSIDTRKPAVMRAAAGLGAAVVNDVSALAYAPDSLATAAALGLPVVLMHAQGTPKTMQDNPTYEHVVIEVFEMLEARVAACLAAGIPLERIAVDPGIGFGKTTQHNIDLAAGLAALHGLGVPVLFGASRKGLIGSLTGETVAARRVHGSVGVALAAALAGAQMIRVHDVAETVQALQVLLPAVGLARFGQ